MTLRRRNARRSTPRTMGVPACGVIPASAARPGLVCPSLFPSFPHKREQNVPNGTKTRGLFLPSSHLNLTFVTEQLSIKGFMFRLDI
jgi:hypothetical protein